MTEKKTGIKEYNEFCKELRAGNILYNINPAAVITTPMAIQ
jgi:hypothetical protein